MKATRLPDGRILARRRAEGPNGEIGDALVPLVPRAPGGPGYDECDEDLRRFGE